VTPTARCGLKNRMSMARELDELGEHASVREVIERFVDISLRFFERDRVLLREVTHLAYSTSAPDVLAGTRVANLAVDRLFIDRLCSAADTPPAAVSDAARFVLVLIAAVLRSYLLFPGQLSPTERRRSRAPLRRMLVEKAIASNPGEEGSC